MRALGVFGEPTLGVGGGVLEALFWADLRRVARG